jgi:uncharacterized protein
MEQLVDLIDQYGNLADLPKLCEILDLDPGRQEAEALAARGNMTAIVRMLHDKSSQLMDMLIRALAQGKLCVVDVSQMRGGQSLVLSGLILQRIFDRNQEEFTSADPKTIPTIAVVEEAQTVLNENAGASDPYIAWVKEGRKYDLGALLITQQPGSIPVEILSQGDNWFLFHLLSAADLNTLKRANAHFSDDLLSSLLNEPIEGQGVFWSSVGGKPYPVSLRVRSFEQQFPMRDPNYNRPPGKTVAQAIRDAVSPPGGAQPVSVAPAEEPQELEVEPDRTFEPVADAKQTMESQAIAAVRANTNTMTRLTSEDGMAWYGFQLALMDCLPEIDNRDQFAFNLVPRALSEIFDGAQGVAWETYTNPRTSKRWVRRKR